VRAIAATTACQLSAFQAEWRAWRIDRGMSGEREAQEKKDTAGLAFRARPPSSPIKKA
jgi:hypothetical protein